MIHATSVKTEEAAIDEAETTGAEEMTEVAITAETIPIIVTGSVLSVRTLISHSELNVIDVENPKVLAHPTSSATIEAAEIIDVEEMTVVEEMIEEAEMTVEIIAVIIQTTIGIVRNVTTLTSHSELNVIDVENLRVKSDLTNAVVTIEEDGATVVAGMTAVEEKISAVGMTAVIIQTMIGNVENVRIPTSLSEQNVTAVEHLKAVEKEHLPRNGKVMIEGLATGKRSKLLGRETGIVHNVESPILLGEMTVSVVDVLRE